MDFHKSLADLGVSIFNSHRIFSKYIPSMLLSSTLAVGVFSPQFSIAEEMAIEEVIVTAQKREQSIQDVPISISAFNEEFLNNAQFFGDSGAGEQLIDMQSVNTFEMVFEIDKCSYAGAISVAGQ